MHSKFARGFSYFVLVVSLALIGYLVFKDLNWVLGDDDFFLRTTMIGKLGCAWSGERRFCPLALFDYSILLLLPKSIAQTIEAHFAYNLIVMSVAIFSLYHFFNKLNEKNYGLNLFFVLILFLVSSFVQIHMNCIYPERMMFFLQVLFMYFWLKGYQSGSMKFYVFSWIFCTYLIFSKEPMFGSVLVIALINLIFGWNQFTIKDHAFLILQTISAVIYLCVYICKISGEINLFSQGVDAIDVMVAPFIGEPTLWLIFLFVFVRAYFVFAQSDRRTLFLDSLLFGAASYVIMCIILVQSDSSSVFPALVFAFPSFVFWTDYLWKNNRFASVAVILLCVASSYFSCNTSKDFIQNTYQLRNNDVKVVDIITDAYIEGKYVYFFTNGEPVTRFRIGAVHGNVWEFDVFTYFTNYILKRKDYFRDENIIRPIEKLEYVFDDSIVMCPSEMNQKYKDYLESRGFRLIQSALNTDIFKQ